MCNHISCGGAVNRFVYNISNIYLQIYIYMYICCITLNFNLMIRFWRAQTGTMSYFVFNYTLFRLLFARVLCFYLREYCAFFACSARSKIQNLFHLSSCIVLLVVPNCSEYNGTKICYYLCKEEVRIVTVKRGSYRNKDH